MDGALISMAPMRTLPDAARTARLTTDELRRHFLVADLFRPGALTLHHVDLDRAVIGGAVPTETPLRLIAPPELRAEYFTERRELGVLAIKGTGRVTVDGTEYTLRARDLLYVGRGSRDVTFASDDARDPGRFYLVSYPAHAQHPTALVRASDADTVELGTAERANRRRLSRYVHLDGVRSAQLVMGLTELLPGSVWNTMPPHTHQRRTEIYLYFDVPEDAVVFHQMGEPGETRHLIVRNEEACLSPAWSIHAGCGTSSYAFCWAMGGENQDFADMQAVEMRTLR